VTDLTPTTAVVLIPPRVAWEPIQAIRRVHDRQVSRWMPHVTLLYPFWPAARFDEAAVRLAEACAGIATFGVTLVRFRSFAHSPRRFTIWLEPDPREPLVRLQTALQAAFPECDAQSRFPGGFTPHLSVGQAQGEGGLETLLDRIRPGWRPLRLDVTEVSVIARDERGPFEVIRTARLGVTPSPPAGG